MQANVMEFPLPISALYALLLMCELLEFEGVENISGCYCQG